MSPVWTRPVNTERLVERLRALTEAVDLCRGRVDHEAVERAESLVRRADRRLALSGDATVVALAGATGSGKSSLFNALVGDNVATVGVRRPTTSTALSASWGTGQAAELLDWLEVPQRYAVPGVPAAGKGGPDRSAGLVLLDLPDHDSVALAHRQEAERLVELVDLLVWVVDPQKYADAALHERFLVPLARHAPTMLMVLNQVDRLGEGERLACVRDLERLLASEGLKSVPVVPTSAATGEGLVELRRRLDKLAAGKRAAAARLAADLDDVATELSAACGTARPSGVPAKAVATMNRSLAEAAGVPAVTDAVAKAWRRKGAMATGWPVLSWIGRFRPDPLRRLHLDRWRVKGRLSRGSSTRQLEAGAAVNGRTSLPAATGIQSARVDSAVRALADETAAGLPRGWLGSVKVAARRHADQLPDALDQAIANADLDLHRHRRWWSLIRVLQWLLIITVLVGLAWLTSGVVLAYFQLPPLPRVSWYRLPAPTVLTVGGVLAGILLGALARIGVSVGARRRALQAGRTLRSDLGAVTAELVVAPVKEELAGYERAVAALDRARR